LISPASPENLRLGKAIGAFEKAERAIVGIRSDAKKPVLEELFAPFTPQIIFMRTESAEMVKHALNSFLALSITFINEVAGLCECTGADAKEVSIGLKSEARIDPRLISVPVVHLPAARWRAMSSHSRNSRKRNGEKIFVIPAIKHSNDLHRGWAFRRLQLRLGELRGKKISVLGLTYTTNTDTLRRSAAVELCRQLLAAGAKVSVFDPAVKTLPIELNSVSLAGEITVALTGADAVAICTEWPQFRQAAWAKIIPTMRQPVFVDANRFLEKELKSVPGVEHLSVGRS